MKNKKKSRMDIEEENKGEEDDNEDEDEIGERRSKMGGDKENGRNNTEKSDLKAEVTNRLESRKPSQSFIFYQLNTLQIVKIYS